MAHRYVPLSSRVNPLRPISKVVLLCIVFGAITSAGFGLLWLFLSLVDVVLANPIVYNVVYAITVFGVGACMVGQVGGWLSKKSPEDGRFSEFFWRWGPLILLALLCVLYLWADYLQSFH